MHHDLCAQLERTREHRGGRRRIDGDNRADLSADQIARGMRARKVPSDASVQRVGELFSTDVLDEPDVIAALKLL